MYRRGGNVVSRVAAGVREDRDVPGPGGRRRDDGAGPSGEGKRLGLASNPGRSIQRCPPKGKSALGGRCARRRVFGVVQERPTAAKSRRIGLAGREQSPAASAIAVPANRPRLFVCKICRTGGGIAAWIYIMLGYGSNGGHATPISGRPTADPANPLRPPACNSCNWYRTAEQRGPSRAPDRCP